MAAEFLFPFGTPKTTATPDPQVLGQKGANISAMSALGLPVPPGFVLGIELGKRCIEAQGSLPDGTMEMVVDGLKAIESSLGRRFGDNNSPLLVSVRSGAAASMPGMMDTVLNLGLNDETVLALAQETDDARFAWDTYRRFIRSFADVVMGIDGDLFEDILEEAREQNGCEADSDLSETALQSTVVSFKDCVASETGQPFPQDVHVQLELALAAVFNSWNTPRAVRYRDMNHIDHDGGTAAVVQAMVFGNRDLRSCTGVYFTRNPSTGENKPYGEYMVNAQGEDVVSGVRTPCELTEETRIRAMSDSPSMEKLFPDTFEQLLAIGTQLENHFADMQEIEFTVESGRLFMLQTRSGKRNPVAGLKLAIAFASEGIISRQEAVSRCRMETLASMMVTKVQPSEDAVLVAKGLPASPGAASGQIVFTSEAAVQARDAGSPAILVRTETDPKDVHGMDAASAILTSRGGMTSHAAVVARGMGKPCITAAMALKVDATAGHCSAMGKTWQAGEVFTLDGGAGTVYEGRQPVVSPEPDGDLAVMLEWRNEFSAGA